MKKPDKYYPVFYFTTKLYRLDSKNIIQYFNATHYNKKAGNVTKYSKSIYTIRFFTINLYFITNCTIKNKHNLYILKNEQNRQ